MLQQGLDLSNIISRVSIFPQVNIQYDPACYNIPDYYLKPQTSIQDVDFVKLPNDTLFYVFYNYIDQDVQMIVVEQLYKRGWRYASKLDRWGLQQGKDLRIFNWQTWNQQRIAIDPKIKWLSLEQFRSG